MASLKLSRDSGTYVESPLILMLKEPTRSNMAPGSLFGIRVFVQWSKKLVSLLDADGRVIDYDYIHYILHTV